MAKIARGRAGSSDVRMIHVNNDREARGGYSLYVPEYYDATTAWPMVVGLHGGSGNGRDFLWSWLREVRGGGRDPAQPDGAGPDLVAGRPPGRRRQPERDDRAGGGALAHRPFAGAAERHVGRGHVRPARRAAGNGARDPSGPDRGVLPSRHARSGARGAAGGIADLSDPWRPGLDVPVARARGAAEALRRPGQRWSSERSPISPTPTRWRRGRGFGTGSWAPGINGASVEARAARRTPRSSPGGVGADACPQRSALASIGRRDLVA